MDSEVPGLLRRGGRARSSRGRYISSHVFEGASDLPSEWRDKAEFSPYYTDIPISWHADQGLGRLRPHLRLGLGADRRGASAGAPSAGARRPAACSQRASTRVSRFALAAQVVSLAAPDRADRGARLLADEEAAGVRTQGRRLAPAATSATRDAAAVRPASAGDRVHEADGRRLGHPGGDERGRVVREHAGPTDGPRLRRFRRRAAAGRRSSETSPAATIPGSFIVNMEGKRFCDDSSTGRS